jgi:hypothetical protein
VAQDEDTEPGDGLRLRHNPFGVPLFLCSLCTFLKHVHRRGGRKSGEHGEQRYPTDACKAAIVVSVPKERCRCADRRRPGRFCFQCSMHPRICCNSRNASIPSSRPTTLFDRTRRWEWPRQPRSINHRAECSPLSHSTIRFTTMRSRSTPLATSTSFAEEAAASLSQEHWLGNKSESESSKTTLGYLPSQASIRASTPLDLTTFNKSMSLFPLLRKPRKECHLNVSGLKRHPCLVLHSARSSGSGTGSG